MMTTFVEKVHIDRERNITATLRLDMLALAGQAEAVEWFDSRLTINP